MAWCDALRATWHLADGDRDQAVSLLESAGREFFRTLDLSQLGRVSHNLGVAYARSGDHEVALEHYGHAMRHHVEAGRDDHALGSLRAAAACHERAGDLDLALALYARGGEIAERSGHPAEAFRFHLRALELIARHGAPLQAVPYLIARANHGLRAAHPDLAQDELVAFVSTAAELGRRGASVPRRESEPRPRSFPGAASGRRADAFVAEHLRGRLRPTLEGQIRDRLSARWAGREHPLAGFLLSWTGTSFRNRDYQVEFGVPQGHAKHHLREFRDAGLIRQRGIKKGARYFLAFQEMLMPWPGEPG